MNTLWTSAGGWMLHTALGGGQTAIDGPDAGGAVFPEHLENLQLPSRGCRFGGHS